MLLKLNVYVQRRRLKGRGGGGGGETTGSARPRAGPFNARGFTDLAEKRERERAE